MTEFMARMDPLPDLSGQICTRMIVQEYWYEAKLGDEANVVYLQVNGTTWHRVYIDAGVLFWKQVIEPDKADTIPTDLHHSPQVEKAEQFGLLGHSIETITTWSPKWMLAELRLHFSGGLVLVLHNEDDRSTLTVVSDAELRVL